MSDTIDANAVETRIRETALEIVADCDDRDSSIDRVWETVDSMDWVIYTYKAAAVVSCLSSDEEAEAFDRLCDMGFELGKDGMESLDELRAKLVFVYLESAISQKVDQLWAWIEDMEDKIDLAIDDGTYYPDGEYVAFLPDDMEDIGREDGFGGVGKSEEEAREKCREEMEKFLRETFNLDRENQE